MTVSAWILVVTVVFAGLWSGLLLMLTTVLHPMLRPMDDPRFTRFLADFLPIARKAPSNYLAILGMLLGSAAALVALSGDPGAPPFLLTALGFAIVVLGPLLVSSRLAEPNYDVILSRDPEHSPEDRAAARRRYFAFNWIRAAATWTAFGLFLAALVVLLQDAAA